MFRLLLSITLILLSIFNNYGQTSKVRTGIVGLSHSHVHWILGRLNDDKMQVVGIVEKNENLAKRYAEQYQFSMDLVYSSMEDMIKNTNPEAVMAFGPIDEHLDVVSFCAPLGIHIMVEKPLAVNLKQAKKMEALAKKHRIHLLTNYETTWYPSVHKAHDLLTNQEIGQLSQLIIRDGHRGPLKIGIEKEFLQWLTDPKKNGGGAIMDFGCYGANIATWMMKGEKPRSVFAITQQFQTENNPKVDDECTIILEYDKSKTTIQASWNWPIGRKDMEVYGTLGAIYADNKNDLRIRMAKGYDGYDETSLTLENRAYLMSDPFLFFAGVLRKEIKMQPYDLSSLENNMVVMQILEAAKTSAKKGKAVKIK